MAPLPDLNGFGSQQPKKNGVVKTICVSIAAGVGVITLIGMLTFFGTGRAFRVVMSPEAIAQEKVERVAADSSLNVKFFKT
jgi:hypothetical protein